MDAAAQEFPGQKPEPALYLVQPGGAGRREMNMEPRVLVQPFLDSWRLVRRVIVGDDVDFQDMRLAAWMVRFRQLRYLLVDLLQELDPFLRPVAL